MFLTMQDKWIGLLHHVCNDHDWPGGSCDHGELITWRPFSTMVWQESKGFRSTAKDHSWPCPAGEFQVNYIKFRWTWSLTFHFSLICRAVTKISRCRVHAISRQGLKQLWSSFGFICLLVLLDILIHCSSSDSPI